MTAGVPRRRYDAAAQLRTYSHLTTARKVPDDYDLTTSRLHYYVDRGFAVRTPIGDWYERYQSGSPLRCSDWDLFMDPARTTYGRYTALARQREAHVDGILRSIDELGYDSHLPAEWLDVLDRIIGPVRYAVHGLQMVASYAGSMAPGGRLTVALAFQAGHEIRRIQRLTYRMVQLRGTRQGFGTSAGSAWHDDAAWQPVRQLVERLLVTYDWGEALVALNVAVKPVFDGFFVTDLAAAALRRGDPLFAEMLASFSADCSWQREWTRAFTDVCIHDRPENEEVIAGWSSRWSAEVSQALVPLANLLGSREGKA